MDPAGRLVVVGPSFEMMMRAFPKLARPLTEAEAIAFREDLRAADQEIQNYFRLYYTSSGNQFIQSLERAEYSDQLGKIVIPTILLWGKYDFTVPPGVANDALDHLSSSYKKLIIFSNSGHRPMQTESIALQNEIINFAELFK